MQDWEYEATLDYEDGTIGTGRVDAQRHDGWRIASRWGPIRGRAEPTELTLTPPAGRAVSTDEVRRLPLGAVLAASRAQLVKDARAVEAVGWADVDADLTKPGPQQGRQLGVEQLQAVAAVYRQAWLIGRPVNEAVREAFDLTKDGAAKRIVATRKAGLLEGVGPKR